MMSRLAGLHSKFVEVSVAIENEREALCSINVFLDNPQQNSPHLYLDEKLLRTGKKRQQFSSPLAYQLFSWDYKSAVELKFPRDTQRKIVERLKTAWENAPHRVHQGYYELERKVFHRFVAKYPDHVAPGMGEPTGECPPGEREIFIDSSHAGSQEGFCNRQDG